MGEATLVIIGARVLTMDPARPRAEALALAGDRILALGPAAEMRALAGSGARIVDAGGATVLPGFIESHLHLFVGGAELGQLQLSGVEGREALSRAVRDHARRTPGDGGIVGQGCDYAVLGHPPRRQDLDAILPGRPLCLMAADHHTAWANTIALERAGILHGRALGDGNEIVMGADGLANGELREFEAMAPVLRLVGMERAMAGLATGREPEPPPDAAGIRADLAAMARGLAHCARHGFTSLVNMDGNRYTLELLDRLRREGRLSARVRVPFHFRPDRRIEDLAEARAMATRWCDAWLSSGMVKLFMDGVVDSRTAAMLEDYPGCPGHRGAPLYSAERFARIAQEADRMGLQIAVHAIGDLAVRRVLDGYEAARLANGVRDSRHRIEHVELIDRADLPRLAALGVIASLQPAHAPGAMDFALQPSLDVIGRARWRDAYLCADIAAAGARLAFASDWPVADINPLRAIQAALTRPAYPGAGDQRLDLMTALAAYTRDGAFAEHAEHQKGMLRPGFLADVAVLSGDIEAIPPEAIGAMRVAMTICGGRVVWDAGA